MDANGTPNAPNTRAQPSIRSFFQPRPQPSYTAPPSLPVSEPATTLSGSVPSNNSSDSNSKSARAPKSTLPRQASISLISQSHVQPLRRINSLLLPIHYPDSFYHKILSPDPPISFSRVISWTDTDTKVIGGIVCRLDPALASDSTPESPKYVPNSYDIYIQSLALLSPYRGKGLVTAVLNVIIAAATAQSEIRIESLYAHVWTENEEGLEWYSARGFKPEGAVISGYYRRLKPDTAYIFRRRLTPTDHLQSASLPTLQHSQSAPTPTVSSSNSPAPPSDALRPGPPSSARSFQEQGPEREWNDLPEDVLSAALLKPASQLASKEGSTTSSRSSSQSRTVKEKKKRVYPAAAFQG
ncbi:uncharacterized protein LY89DRAFT_680136 [Mollisia scopiformis]|uniref:N-acetyltransferase domain-containing protein n=1 Tax=Mollisia scopiformis TaxID=149040 RepID=A0A194XTA9_MOLSC|nr:uncharacterized protein LY89DRAFT_680136 [Mollisia scopiformis]KUJ23381.1 hypothetical protein LY89DRAFT_680136 [Mollisia scopiformis]